MTSKRERETEREIEWVRVNGREGDKGRKRKWQDIILDLNERTMWNRTFEEQNG